MPCVGVTGEVRESRQFEWEIIDFLSLSTKRHSFYSSPSFMFDSFSLHLNIFPGGESSSKSGFISVFVENESDYPLHVTITFYIKQADHTLIGSKSDDVSIMSLEGIGFSNFYVRSDLEHNKSELVPSGILTIVCILKHIQDGKEATVKAERAEMSILETSDYTRLTELDVLSENLKELSTNKDSCDVILEVKDKEFKAHKAILMARSSVFAAMFQHDTLEKQTGVIKILDCDSESFQKFLDYLYSGKLEDVSFSSVFHLYSTSNKYDVQKLKEFCIVYLIKNLTPNKVCDVVKLADTYNETKLILEAQVFFNENLCKIFPTTEWRSFMATNLRLADKLLVEFSKAKDSQ